MSYRRKLIVALDFPTEDKALQVVDLFADFVDIYKVGFELFLSAGFSLIKKLHKKGKKVFLDLKFHDIPNTVSKATSVVTKSGVFMFNLHASGGLEMMIRCRESARETALKEGIEPPKIIAVTVLTSLTNEILKEELSISHGITSHVKTLSLLARRAELDGVVASPHEIGLIKKVCGRDFLVVTPGIRPSWTPPDDQKRISTPREAIRQGADFIVMGRGILNNEDPIKAVELISVEMMTA